MNWECVFIYRKYAQTIPRDFGVRYNAYTQSIEILDSKPQVQELVNYLSQEINFLGDVMSKINF